MDAFKRKLDMPDWAKDQIHTDVDIHFDWRDRVRILFGYTVRVYVRTLTAGIVGARVESDSEVTAYRARPPRTTLGAVEIRGPVADDDTNGCEAAK